MTTIPDVMAAEAALRSLWSEIGIGEPPASLLHELAEHVAGAISAHDTACQGCKSWEQEWNDSEAECSTAWDEVDALRDKIGDMQDELDEARRELAECRADGSAPLSSDSVGTTHHRGEADSARHRL